jgi:Holliday junction resolvase
LTKKSTNQPTTHDKNVRSIAKKLEKKGYEVKADISGFKTPDGIGKNGRIPDVVAEKNGRKKIIEVETSKSLVTDKKQQATFERSASHQKKTTFQIKKTK